MEGLILIILVIIPGVWSGDWRVTFSNQCVLKGTSVILKCEYDYPGGHFVTSIDWLKARYVSGKEIRLLALTNPPSAPNHFSYVGDKWTDCSLQINDVQHTDEGQYYFKFWTSLGRWRSKASLGLSVKELTAVVSSSAVTEGDEVSLACMSGCDTRVIIVWFRDGQRVLRPVFQARREDAGRYYCAVQGQERARSAAVPLSVHYPPEKVTLSVSPSGDIVKGSSVTLSCSSDASPPVTQTGYRLYKDGRFISSGQSHTIANIQSSHSGLYYCQAWNNISRKGVGLMKSVKVHLDVQYRPVNISISMNPLRVVGGGSVNLSCRSAANPAAHSYTWYRRAVSPNATLQVGSGRVLSLPSVDSSDIGHYICQVSNQLGENNSTEVFLAPQQEQQHGSLTLPITAGIGVLLLVTLVLALLFLWRKQRTYTEKKQTISDLQLSERGSSSSNTEDQSSNIYVNIHTFSISPPPVTDITLHSQRTSHHQHEAHTSSEDEVTYSTVTIKPRNDRPPHHRDNSRDLQESWSKSTENDDSVIYASVAKSS